MKQKVPAVRPLARSVNYLCIYLFIYLSIYLFIHSSEIKFNKQLKYWCGRNKAWQKSDQTVTFVAPGHFHISSHAGSAERHAA